MGFNSAFKGLNQRIPFFICFLFYRRRNKSFSKQHRTKSKYQKAMKQLHCWFELLVFVFCFKICDKNIFFFFFMPTR